MKTEYIDVRGKWGIVVCYDLLRKDVRYMRALMESVGMECQAVDGVIAVAVFNVTTYRMSHILKMDADLVFATCFQLKLH